MQIILYNFSKRLNSTLQPAGDGAAVAVSLKEGTSIYSPSFIINASEAPAVNYLKWDDRYYYIQDNVYLNKGLYQIDCSMDVLATFKAQIQTTSAFVLYSSSNYNTDITDQRLSTDKDATITATSASLITISGCYVVTYIGNNIDGANQTGARVVNTFQFPALIGALSDTGMYASLLSNPADYTTRMFSSATECITGVYFLPFQPNTTAGDAVNIRLGTSYDTGVPGKGILPLTDFGSVDIAIPWQFDDFRNRSAFTTIILYLPGYGALQLNADEFLGKTSINVSAKAASLTGMLTYLVDGRITCCCQVGHTIQIGYSQQGNLGGAVGGALTALTSALSGNVVGAIGGTFNAVTSSLQTNVGSTGTNGGSSALYVKNDIQCIVISHNTNVDPSDMQAEIGRPLNAVTSMKSLSGYVQTVQFSLAAAAPENILQQIDQYMDGGVYLE